MGVQELAQEVGLLAKMQEWWATVGDFEVGVLIMAVLGAGFLIWMKLHDV